MVSKKKSLNYLRTLWVLSLLFFIVNPVDLFAQTQFGPGAQTASYTDSRVRGYYFTSPVAFNICQLYVDNAMNNNVWHVEVVKFTSGAPPSFPGTTNAFTSLFYANNVAGNAPIPCNISVSAGDIIGIYGSRSASPLTQMANSYDGTAPTTSVNGNNFTLYRSGMQFPLNNQQMHDIWTEVGNTGRVFGFYGCCPSPPTPQLTAAPTTVCAGDTFVYSVNPYTYATSYSWDVGTNGTIVESNLDSTIVKVVFNGYYGFGSAQVCVTVMDTCTTSDTCVNVSIAPPSAHAGIDRAFCLEQTIELGATPASAGVGTWSFVSGPTGYVFGDSNLHNSTFTSSNYGTYELAWTIQAGNCPQVSDTITVDIWPKPIAAFQVDNGCEGSPITFTDMSNGNGASIASWDWDVNGNNVADYISQNATHTYSGNGNYNARLIVNNAGCSDTVIHTVFINPKPVVKIDADNVCHKTAVEFENNSSIPFGSIKRVIWKYGDGTPLDSGAFGVANYAPPHNYYLPGTYNVLCKIRSDSGCVAEDQITVQVYNNPLVDFNVANACQYQTSSFNDLTTITGADLDAWAWNFGDGSDSAYVQNPEHEYSIGGVVPVTLYVTSSQGCRSKKTADVEVFPSPVARFNYENLVCLGDTLQLKATSTLSYGTFSNHLWTINDSISYAGAVLNHYFTKIGTYDVRLVSTSDRGCSNTYSKSVPVHDVPTASFEFESVCAEEELSFRDKSTYVEPISRYTWNFDDGDSLSTEHHPVHVFDTHGVYNVTLVVESFRGCKSSITLPVQIFEKLHPEFVADPDSACSPLLVTFTDITKSKSGIAWNSTWNYGDGSVSSEEADHVYINYTGKYQYYPVIMNVLTSEGCESELVMDSAITVIPQPYSQFTHTEKDLMTLTTASPFVQFVNTSKQANWYEWHFGDGLTSELENPSHEWAEAGDYQVVLIAENIYHCLDSSMVGLRITHANIPFIPSAFTPNGDNNNDFFFISGLEQVDDYQLSIYDRWGKVIFSTDNVNDTWDGRDATRNDIIQNGTYGYKIQYRTLVSRDKIEKNGTVTVLGVE